MLEAEPDHVDLLLLQRMLDQAREPGCSEARQAHLLRKVLALWRGAPLAGVPGEWAGRIRSGIETQLISAAVEWAQVESRLGRPDLTIDKLSRLTSLYPYAEPLVAALMRALCAAGRVAEALQHYASLRIHLRDELGAEPGPELRRLHTAILRGELPGDGSPAVPSLVVTSLPYRPPRQLPTAPTGFSGRQRELAFIDGVFTTAAREGYPPVVAIHGAAGVGKSALAIHAAHRLADRFPDGQLYVDLKGPGAPATTAEILDRFLRALGVPEEDRPSEVEEAAFLFRTLTADQRLLVVVDNACGAGGVTQLRYLSPGSPACGMLVTSRRAQIGMDTAVYLPVDVLPPPAAVEMLTQLLGVARIAPERAAAAEVARWCGYLPLALRAAAARLAARPGWPVVALAHRLREESTRLDELDFAELSVRSAFASSYEELAVSPDPVDRDAAEAFTRLGYWTCPELSHADVAALLNRPPEEVEPLLERLVDARLLESPAPARYRMPDLIRLYAREQRASVTADRLSQALWTVSDASCRRR